MSKGSVLYLGLCLTASMSDSLTLNLCFRVVVSAHRCLCSHGRNRRCVCDSKHIVTGWRQSITIISTSQMDRCFRLLCCKNATNSLSTQLAVLQFSVLQYASQLYTCTWNDSNQLAHLSPHRLTPLKSQQLAQTQWLQGHFGDDVAEALRLKFTYKPAAVQMRVCVQSLIHAAIHQSLTHPPLTRAATH